MKCPQCGSDFDKEESVLMVEYHINAHVSGIASTDGKEIYVTDVEPVNDNITDEAYHPVIGKPIYFCENCGHKFTKKQAIRILSGAKELA